jgi:hypothetical protein
MKKISTFAKKFWTKSENTFNKFINKTNNL